MFGLFTQRGEQAVGGLEAEGLLPRLELLDVRDDASVQALADTIAQRHGGWHRHFQRRRPHLS